MSSSLTFYKMLGIVGGGIFILIAIGMFVALRYPFSPILFYDIPVPLPYEHIREASKNLPRVGCTSDAECREGFSCWYQIPAGPSAGIRGSKEYPGACWDNDILSQIY